MKALQGSKVILSFALVCVVVCLSLFSHVTCKNEEIWHQTQNHRRFPGFAVVVVTLFDDILHDFHDVFRNVSFSQRKSTTHLGRSLFFRRKATIFIGRETKTHSTDENRRKKIAKVSPSNDNYSCRITNHSTTNNKQPPTNKQRTTTNNQQPTINNQRSTINDEVHDDEAVTAGGERPAALPEPRLQGRVQRHAVEQLADVVPMVQILDIPVPQVVDQMVDVAKHIDIVVLERVIEVPKISCPPRPLRASLVTTQKARSSWWRRPCQSGSSWHAAGMQLASRGARLHGARARSAGYTGGVRILVTSSGPPRRDSPPSQGGF